MKKVDLHVHSKFSSHPSEWFLQRLGTSESYTEPEFIYDQAIKAGMSFVTVTDHNCIEASLILKEKYPKMAFTGVECTAYFPEDSCKVHVLVYGLNAEQFEEIEKNRLNIYHFRDYLLSQNLAHSVAHATYSVNGKLDLIHMEKLLLLFDVFESINGARDKLGNSTLASVISSLTPEHMKELQEKYNIIPASCDPWIKGLTGGSDDHAGLFIGRTYACSQAGTVEELLDNIRNKKTIAQGRHNDYHSFVFAIYKIAYDFSLSKSGDSSRSFFSRISEFIFKKEKISLKDRIQITHMKKKADRNGNRVNVLLAELIEGLNSREENGDERFDMIYAKTAEITDEFFLNFMQSLERNIKKADIHGITKNISSWLPAFFLTLPFFTSLKHFNDSRGLLNRLTARFCPENARRSKRILWFTDTIDDLNGVSVTLKNAAHFAGVYGRDIRIVCCRGAEETLRGFPANVLVLPGIYSFSLPFYENYNLHIPSILNSLKIIHEYNPDEIYVSTPGPVGLFGLLSAKVLNIPCRGIYHTDFTLQAEKISDDSSASSIIESGVRWFYSCMDEIKVPTESYIEILKLRGYDETKMSIFRRGIDSALFTPRKSAKTFLREMFGITGGNTLAYSGRISKDKNLDFLVQVYSEIIKIMPDTNLLVIGDGPYAAELRKKTMHFGRIYFAGSHHQSVMPVLYSGCEALLFPSTTDTFGMAVLEAQSCGIPAIVSETGGPAEIILDRETGFIAKTDSLLDWVDRTVELLKLAEECPGSYEIMKMKSRSRVLENHNWENVLKHMTDKIEETKPENIAHEEYSCMMD
jgi:glycosyltransferase involved in cell wall biosynthesis